MRKLQADTPIPETDEAMLEYLPDDPSVRGLYRMHRAKGLSVIEAATEVLKVYVGFLALGEPKP